VTLPFGGALEEGEAACGVVGGMVCDNATEYTDGGHSEGCMVIRAAINYAAANREVHRFLAIGAVRKGELPPEADVAAV
jgi:hypothetical protein